LRVLYLSTVHGLRQQLAGLVRQESGLCREAGGARAASPEKTSPLTRRRVSRNCLCAHRPAFNSTAKNLPSNLEPPLRLRREQLFRLQAAMADALLVGILAERVERRPVRFDPVRPVIVAENVARPARVFVMPRDRKHRGGRRENPLNAAALR